MTVLNNVSIGMTIIIVLAMIACWLHVKSVILDYIDWALLVLLYLVGTVASILASALSLAVGRFWVYPIAMGLVIFGLLRVNYWIQQAREN